MLAGIAVFLLPRVSPGLCFLACQKSKCTQKFLFCRLFRLSIRNQDRQTRRPANWESRWETARQNTPLCRRLKYYVPLRGGTGLPAGTGRSLPDVIRKQSSAVCPRRGGHDGNRTRTPQLCLPGLLRSHAHIGTPAALPPGVLFSFWGGRNRTGLLMQRIAPTERGNGPRTPVSILDLLEQRS